MLTERLKELRNLLVLNPDDPMDEFLGLAELIDIIDAALTLREDSLLEWLKDGLYREKKKYTVHWIEAEVPIPEPAVIEGRVSE